MLNRTTLLALGAALAIALVPVAASAKGGNHGGNHGGNNNGGGKIASNHHGHHHKHRWHRGTIVIGTVATGAVAAYAATNNCNCLTKDYLPDGSVVFKDLCTKESAINATAVKQTEVVK